MTRKRAEKLLTAAMCGRGYLAKDIIAAAREGFPVESNEKLLKRASISLHDETLKTLFVILAAVEKLECREDKGSHRWEAAERKLEKRANQMCAVMDKATALRRQLAGGGA